MRRVLLGISLLLSLWPAAVIVLAAQRVLVGGGKQAVAETTAAAPAPAQRPRPAPAPAAASAAAAKPAPRRAAAGTPVTRAPDLAALDRLRDETADLVLAVNRSPVTAGVPDGELVTQALEVEADIMAWQEANEGTSADAEFFASLFAEIAAATADYATSPTTEAKARLDEIVMRHRRETLQGGA